MRSLLLFMAFIGFAWSAAEQTFNFSICSGPYTTCLHSPAECVTAGKGDTCKFGVALTQLGKNSEWLQIELYTRALGAAKKYMAVAFQGEKCKQAKDEKDAEINCMAKTPVIECSMFKEETALTAKFSWNNEKPENVRIAAASHEVLVKTTGLSLNVTSVVDDLSYCKILMRAKNAGLKGKADADKVFSYDKSKHYLILFAQGDTAEDGSGLMAHAAGNNIFSGGREDFMMEIETTTKVATKSSIFSSAFAVLAFFIGLCYKN